MQRQEWSFCRRSVSEERSSFFTVAESVSSGMLQFIIKHGICSPKEDDVIVVIIPACCMIKNCRLHRETETLRVVYRSCFCLLRQSTLIVRCL